MNNHLRIPVTPHVWKYIWNQYGPGDKFDLASSRQNALRIALTNVSITAESIPSPERLPGKHLYLDLGKSGELKEIAHLSQPWLKSGYFFQHEFNQALRNYIEAQRDLATQMGLPETQWNARIGLESFMEKYGIEDYEYSYDSLRRQYNRVNRDRMEYFDSKLTTKYDFCPCSEGFYFDFQKKLIKTCFEPCRYIGGQRPRIHFHAFSRSSQKIVLCEMYVPKRLIITNDHWEWIDMHFRIINGYLRRGYTIK